MLFMLEYQINHSQKMDAFGAASMSPDDDAAIEAAHGYRQIGAGTTQSMVESQLLRLNHQRPARITHDVGRNGRDPEHHTGSRRCRSSRRH